MKTWGLDFQAVATVKPYMRIRRNASVEADRVTVWMEHGGGEQRRQVPVLSGQIIQGCVVRGRVCFSSQEILIGGVKQGWGWDIIYSVRKEL